MTRKLAAEFIGTFWLVLGGCGSAVLAAHYADVGIGFLGISFAFGLTVLTMAYAIGHISGCHLNPAVSIGLWAGGRFPASGLVPYVLSQLAGAVAGAGILYVIATGKSGFDITKTFGCNGYEAHSPGQYSHLAFFVTEIIMTINNKIIIIKTNKRHKKTRIAPIAIGLGLTLIHLISIPVTNTSVNPARSTGPAVIAGGWALQELWLFWVAPIIGAVIAGLCYNTLFEKD